MKKTRHTEAQMQSAYNEWQRSGLSKKAYCLKNNIVSSVFFYWIKKLGAMDDSTTNSFQQIKVPKQKAFPHVQEPTIEIEYPSGVKLRVYQKVDTSWLKAII